MEKIKMLVTKVEENLIKEFREKKRIKGIISRAEKIGKYDKHDYNRYVRLLCKNTHYGKYDGEIGIIQDHTLCDTYTKDELGLDVMTNQGIINIPLRMCIPFRKKEPEWIEI